MSSALVWLRRDLRDDDHAALYHALKRHTQVYVAFVFDTDILDALTDKQTAGLSLSGKACGHSSSHCKRKVAISWCCTAVHSQRFQPWPSRSM